MIKAYQPKVENTLIKNVSHVFVVLGAYTTEVDFIRGTGFAERLETPNYLQEYSRGTYG